MNNRISLTHLIIIIFLFLATFASYSDNLDIQDIDFIKKGEELYKKRCANCHGKNAKGKNNGFFLSPNLTNFEKGYNGFLNILTNGYGRMPAWGGRSKLTNLQLDELASYLKHISTEKANWN